MKLLVLITVVAGLSLVACSGGEDSERVLRLRDADMTEAEFRLAVRAWFASVNTESFCRSLDGLSDEEAADVIVAAQRRVEPASNAQETPENGEERVAAIVETRNRAAAIFKEECERIF